MSWPRDDAKLDRVRALMRERGLEALVVRAPDNVLYLTNFWGMKGYDAVVVPRAGAPTRLCREARAAAAEMGASNVEFVEAEAERLPFADASFDVVISNGVIDLVPDKDAVFAELYRVLAPGGRMQIADVTIQNPVSAEGRRNIDLWTG